MLYWGRFGLKKTQLHGGMLYISGGDTFCVIPAHDGGESLAQRIGGAVVCPDCRWSIDLPPWDAPALYPENPPFSGGAGEYLEFIESSLMKEAAEALGFMPEKPVIAGYSLAGLFAAYALIKSDIFCSAVCASPSMWYEGFTDFMALRSERLFGKSLYLSVGKKEKRTKNRRMARVEDEIRKAYSIAEDAGARTVFELNDGGHFADAALRLKKGFDWLSGRNDG